MILRKFWVEVKNKEVKKNIHKNNNINYQKIVAKVEVKPAKGKETNKVEIKRELDNLQVNDTVDCLHYPIIYYYLCFYCGVREPVLAFFLFSCSFKAVIDWNNIFEHEKLLKTINQKL